MDPAEHAKLLAEAEARGRREAQRDARLDEHDNQIKAVVKANQDTAKALQDTAKALAKLAASVVTRKQVYGVAILVCAVLSVVFTVWHV